MNLLDYFCALFARAPARLQPSEPPILTDPERGKYYQFRDRRLYFATEPHRRVCLFIMATGKYPPRGVIGHFEAGRFGLLDREWGTFYPLRRESNNQYKIVRELIRADREEALRFEANDASAIDWRPHGDS